MQAKNLFITPTFVRVRTSLLVSEHKWMNTKMLFLFEVSFEIFYSLKELTDRDRNGPITDRNRLCPVSSLISLCKILGGQQNRQFNKEANKIHQKQSYANSVISTLSTNVSRCLTFAIMCTVCSALYHVWEFSFCCKCRYIHTCVRVLCTAQNKWQIRMSNKP